MGGMIELMLPSMTCGHCVHTVTEAVHRVDPAATLEIELPAHRVQIDSNKPREDFVRELTQEGYAPCAP